MYANNLISNKIDRNISFLVIKAHPDTIAGEYGDIESLVKIEMVDVMTHVGVYYLFKEDVVVISRLNIKYSL